ncbi:hypothetical protein HAX54_008674, partial [Datura stramonium]|nr:hypothetical protein [Datura stramonium]
MAIKRLEDIMNLLSSQMAAQHVTKVIKAPPSPLNVDEEVVGWEVDEEILKETFASILLNGEGLEEVCHVIKGLGTYTFQRTKKMMTIGAQTGEPPIFDVYLQLSTDP